MAFGVKISVDDSEVLRQANSIPDRVSAKITTTAHTRTGIPIVKILDKGRGPIRPVSAKALKIPIPGVQFIPAEGGTKSFIFRKFAGPARPQFVLSKTRLSVLSSVPLISATHRNRGSFRTTLVSFVNRVGELALSKIRQFTPSRTGKVRESYELERAN